MAVLKNKDIKGMNAEELKKKLKELSLELIKSRLQRAQGTALKTKEIKKTIARILTHENKKFSGNNKKQ
jgi:ribosomal protein L29